MPKNMEVKKYNYAVKFLFLFVQFAFLNELLSQFITVGLRIFIEVTFLILLTYSFMNYTIQDIGLKIITNFKSATALFLGAIITFSLQLYAGFGAVLAASSVGLIAYFIHSIKRDDSNIHIAGYCGTFIGMTSPLVFKDFYAIIMAGIIGAIVYVFSRNVFNGVGGKLGSIAFVAVCLTVFFFLK